VPDVSELILELAALSCSNGPSSCSSNPRHRRLWRVNTTWSLLLRRVQVPQSAAAHRSARCHVMQRSSDVEAAQAAPDSYLYKANRPEDQMEKIRNLHIFLLARAPVLVDRLCTEGIFAGVWAIHSSCVNVRDPRLRPAFKGPCAPRRCSHDGARERDSEVATLHVLTSACSSLSADVEVRPDVRSTTVRRFAAK